MKRFYALIPRFRPPSKPRPRVLYVEDEDLNWEVAAGLLSEDFELVRARDALECFEKLAVETFQLILMDIALASSPLNGLETLQLLKGAYGGVIPTYARGVQPVDVPIIVVSAVERGLVEADILKAGVHEIFAKPVDFLRLHSTMQAALGLQSAQDAS